MNPSIENRGLRHYVGIRRNLRQREIGQELPPLIGRVFAWLASQNIEPTGAPFFRYHVVADEDHLNVEVAVPIDASVDLSKGGEIQPGILPSGDYLVFLHIGSYDKLQAVTRKLKEWASLEGVSLCQRPDGTWGARIETYLSGPEESPDPANWKTEISILCDGAG